MSEEAKVKPYVATVEEGTAYWMVDILWVVLATGEQTGGEYSLMWQLCPKGSGPGSHYHDQNEQFFIVDGEITYLANGEELRAKSGSFVLIPRGTVHSFRVDSETATFLNSYTPAGFERTITELGEPAQAREIPPPDRPTIPAGFDAAVALFREIGMHPVQEPDVLREGRGEV
jgi:quercetin dioxygenase-like cupin family protein